MEANKPNFNAINFKVYKKKSIESFVVKNSTNLTDSQLWLEFKDGKESSYALIYEQNVALLYSYGLKLVNDKELVKDSIQDLFIEIWEAKEKLGNVQSIKAYLYTSLRRKLLSKVSKLRKTFDKSKIINELDQKIASAEFSLIEKQRFDEQRKALQKAFKMLTDKQKEIIHLKFYGKLNYNEISQIMSLDRKGVYNLMTRTINKLKKHLKLSSILTIVYFILL